MCFLSAAKFASGARHGMVLVLCLAIAADNWAGEPPAMRTWTEASTGKTIEAEFLAVRAGKIRLRTADGNTYELALERLSQADRDYVEQSTAGTGKSTGRGAEMKIKPLAEPPSDASARPDLMDSVVTGVGTTPDEAKQNAFANAIEQVVGILVDAETIVQNDELVRDKVLTISRGFVRRFEVLREWQEGALHHVRIHALVEVHKLAESLKANNIAIREIPGERISRQTKFEVQNEEQAGELFAKIMADYRIENLFDVEIVGEPKVVEKNQVEAKLLVKLRLVPAESEWKVLRENLLLLLEKIATKRTPFATEHGDYALDVFRPMRIEGRRESAILTWVEKGTAVVSLYKSANLKRSETYWDVFQVPDSLGNISDVIQGIEDRSHEVQVDLLDSEGIVVASEKMQLTRSHINRDNRIILEGFTNYFSCLGPLFWDPLHFSYRFVYPCELTISVGIEDLARVKKVVAVARKVSAPSP
jgi:hypothetical protein